MMWNFTKIGPFGPTPEEYTMDTRPHLLESCVGELLVRIEPRLFDLQLIAFNYLATPWQVSFRICLK